MKTFFTALSCFLCISCLKEPKKPENNAIKNDMIESTSNSKINEVDGANSMKNSNTEQKIEEKLLDNIMTVNINNLQKLLNKNLKYFSIWSETIGYKFAVIDNTNDIKSIIYIKDKNLLRYCVDNDYNSLQLISFTIYDIKEFDMIKKEILSKNYVFDEHLDGNILHYEPDYDYIRGFKNDLYTVYFSVLKNREYMITIQKNTL